MTKFSAAQQSQLAQIGAFLRENREKQGKSLEDIAIHTYIRPQLLNGIEMGNPDLLPEPIFVQGFIRRYAENLGLKGLELSQQFTVTSIPSTPRPAPRSAELESSTTRLTRPVTSSNGQSAAPAVTSNAMFSAGSLSPVGEPLPKTEEDSSPQPPADLPADDDIPVIVDDPVMAPATPSTASVDSPALREDFAEKVSAFDQANLNLPVSEAPVSEVPVADIPVIESPVVAPLTADVPDVGLPNGSPTLDSPESAPPFNDQLNNQFDDGLPAAFTTQVTSTEPATAPRTAYSSAPVGVEIGSDTAGPNLKPFAIGAIMLAALTAGVVLLANLLGGDRTPSVAESPDPVVEPTVESVEPIESPPPAPAPAPPASSSPVYVEAEATAETYVSVRVDGVIIFEDIMQPGDTLLWEGEEVIDVYSGNAGGLTIAANGEPGEVLGEDGQLGQKVFEAP